MVRYRTVVLVPVQYRPSPRGSASYRTISTRTCTRTGVILTSLPVTRYDALQRLCTFVATRLYWMHSYECIALCLRAAIFHPDPRGARIAMTEKSISCCLLYTSAACIWATQDISCHQQIPHMTFTPPRPPILCAVIYFLHKFT